MIQTFNLEPYRKEIDDGLAELVRQRIIPRIFDKDGTVWTADPAAAAGRLGWLTSPRTMERQLADIKAFAGSARRSGLTKALLLGMGGSSLAPYVLASVFKTRKGFLELDILDSTVPEAVLRARKNCAPETTLFIVSSKSGTTAETNSFFSYFWNRTREVVGPASVAGHFAAITDPGTPLETAAVRLGFRKVFQGDPEIGGRFSALSPFCLAPAALKGIRIEEILAAARRLARLCRGARNLRANPGAFLGSVIGVLAGRGLDKLTIVLPRRLESFGLWLEQLIAESTGKNGRGILPVTGEPLRLPEQYGRDRLFVALKAGPGAPQSGPLGRLIKAGFPVLVLGLPRAADLGEQFFLWEFATAVAGRFLGINPFDQPDVESAKRRTQALLQVFRTTGALPAEKPRFRTKGVSVFSDVEAPNARACLAGFLAQSKPGGYIALQAFLPPAERTESSLQELRLRLGARTGLATTVGFGPRFLHSTGQLHKGDGGRGLFVQITAADPKDAPIPDGRDAERSTVSFGVLKSAQAQGDGEALRTSGRRVIRFDLGCDVERGFRTVLSLIG